MARTEKTQDQISFHQINYLASQKGPHFRGPISILHVGDFWLCVGLALMGRGISRVQAQSWIGAVIHVEIVRNMEGAPIAKKAPPD